MPDPASLKVGDLIRFIDFPEEWQQTKSTVLKECRDFMKVMISRRSPSRVYEIDEYGTPWIAARVKQRGRIYYHFWGVSEHTGWRIVQTRQRKRRESLRTKR